MPRDFFQYLIKVCRIFVAADLAGGFDKALTSGQSESFYSYPCPLNLVI